MRIARLEVHNFRCFERAAFEFQPGFNLLVGVNGSGKTSLLKAVAASLAPVLNGVAQPEFSPLSEENNTRLALTEVRGRVRYERCYPVSVDVSGELCEQQRSWRLEQSGPGSEPQWEHAIFCAIGDEAAQIAQGGHGVLPVAAFYGAGRKWLLTGMTAETAVRRQDSRLDAYASWHDAALDVEGLQAWVIAKSLERLEAMADGGYALRDEALGELDVVNEALARAMPDAKGLRYDIKYRRLLLEWHHRKPVPFETLSDGQRTLAALVADIARRMCLLNPQLAADQILKVTPGIVLIDELDMHLHPAWQRRIAGVLKQVFPSVQFIAASHSPQIIGELDPQEILILHGGRALGHPERAFGLESGEVLQEIMDAPARNPGVAMHLASIRRALDDERLDEAKQELTELEQQVGEIPDVLEVKSALDTLRWLREEGGQ